MAAEEEKREKLRIVCLSDTHGHTGSEIQVPEGDILIHAGDFTHFGKEKDFHSFEEWMASLPHPIKITVNGNHESNAFRDKTKGKKIIRSSQLLINEATKVKTDKREKEITIFGTDFYWPAPSGNPYFDLVPSSVDILVAHGPPKGFVDGKGAGCPSLTEKIKQIKPKLVVCGHIHSAHGVVKGEGEFEGITFVNAAMVKNGYSVGWEVIVVDL